MALGRCRSVALHGVDGVLVDVESHLGGMPGFTLVGGADRSVREAHDRARAAALSCGLPWPQQRITVNLAPATMRKTGTHFDLALAVAVLAAAEVVPHATVRDAVVLGELALDGRVRPVPGVLPAVRGAVAAGVTRVVVPTANADEARVVAGASVLPATCLDGLVRALNAATDAPGCDHAPESVESGAAGRSVWTSASQPDLADVVGQPFGRRLAEVAAAGGHHLLLQGPPGAGKTMIARRIPGLLPDLTLDEALEVAAVRSVAGVLSPADLVVTRPPVVDPHHTASASAIIGGGTLVLRPGAISLAHRGVLLLDEAPEFNRRVLESLRQPLESGVVVVDRAHGSARFPAFCQLVMTANPCPCGWSGVVDRTCMCSPHAVLQYRRRVSGPVLDRLDLVGHINPIGVASVAVDQPEDSATVADRVAQARDRQVRRHHDEGGALNARVATEVRRRRWPPDPAGTDTLSDLQRRGLVSGRGADRILGVAWTLADLAERARPGREDVLEAHAYRAAVMVGVAA
jgi:magnesium chelatase family protein